jgi:hypothetical protein
MSGPTGVFGTQTATSSTPNDVSGKPLTQKVFKIESGDAICESGFSEG